MIHAKMFKSIFLHVFVSLFAFFKVPQNKIVHCTFTLWLSAITTWGAFFFACFFPPLRLDFVAFVCLLHFWLVGWFDFLTRKAFIELRNFCGVIGSVASFIFSQKVLGLKV